MADRRFALLKHQKHDKVLLGDGTVALPSVAFQDDPDSGMYRIGDNDIAMSVNGVVGLRLKTDGVILSSGAVQRLRTNASGVAQLRSDGSTDTEDRTLKFEHQDATDRAEIGHNEGSDVFSVRNMIHGGNLVLSAEMADGTAIDGYTFDPDGVTTIKADTNFSLLVKAGAEAAILAEADGAVTLYHNAVAAFQTQVNTASVFALAMTARAAYQQVVTNPFGRTSNATPYTFILADANTIIQRSNTTACTWTIPPRSSVPFSVGDKLRITRTTATGTMTVAPGAGVTLRWLDNGTAGTGSHAWTVASYQQITYELFINDVWFGRVNN